MVESCPRCYAHAFVGTTRSVVRRLGARVFTKMIAIQRCDACDFSPIPVDAILAFERAIGTQLALFGPATNETFQFMRRAMGLDPEETARAVGACIGDVLAWERRQTKVPLPAWLMLARVVRDRAAAEGTAPSFQIDGASEPLRSPLPTGMLGGTRVGDA